tara:strand:- start:1100 stop:1939 length:840 start_codon:yes stop_codon:yes gene_type:complete
MNKNAETEWIDGWDKQLEIAEKKEVANVKRFYKQQYSEAIKLFRESGQTSNFTTVFKRDDFISLYSGMYERIGFRFASYFRKSYSLIFKELDTSGFDDIWKQVFSQLGIRVGEQIAPNLKSTTDKTLKTELTKFLNDPNFIKTNEVDSGRIISSRFANIAEWQAKRIVRTESTFVANMGTQQSAKDTFGKNELMKKWKTSTDERVRSSHASLHNVKINYTDLFNGIMLVPADRSNGASARDVVNCRCRIILMPKKSVMEAAKLTPQGARQVQGIIREFT